MTATRKPIVIVGSINMDLVAQVRQIPAPGQTVIGTGFDTTPGGKGANQAVAAARLGYPTEMVGAVGDDVFGQALLDNLHSANVGIGAVARVAGPSGVAPILLGANERKLLLLVVPGANGKMDCAAIDRQAALSQFAGAGIGVVPVGTADRNSESHSGAVQGGGRARNARSRSGRCVTRGSVAAGGMAYAQ